MAENSIALPRSRRRRWKPPWLKIIAAAMMFVSLGWVFVDLVSIEIYGPSFWRVIGIPIQAWVFTIWRRIYLMDKREVRALHILSLPPVAMMAGAIATANVASLVLAIVRLGIG